MVFLISLFSNNLLFAKNPSLNEVFCDTSSINLLGKNTNSISYKDQKFEKIISEIEKDISNKKFNLLVALDARASSGYKLEFNKIKIKKKNKAYVYFYEIKPQKNSKNLSVITYPFCLVQIDNLDEYKVKIKKKRSKIFPFSIFQ